MSANLMRHESEFASFEYVRPRMRPAKPVAVATAPVICRSQMHPDVYKLALACWAMLLAIFWITFFVSTGALFMVVIGTGYAIVFFGVPFLMSRIAGQSSTASYSLRDFARGTFDTIYGPIGGFEALLQVILVPLAVSMGGVAIGIIIHLARTAH